MARKKCPEPKAGLPEWMATYGDMVTLLMCFFVLLFAFSNIDSQKFHAVMNSFQGSAGILSGGKSLSEAPFVFDAMPEEQTSNMETIEDYKPFNEKKELDELREKLEEYIEEQNLNANIDVVQTDTSIVLRFKDNALFEPLSADIKEDSVSILIFLADILSAKDLNHSEVIVEGHTDNLPTNTAKYETNWELSVIRATNVLRFFVELQGLDPFRMSAAGYGETRPIATNTTEEGRALNRRVDIIIKTGGDKNGQE